MLLTNNKKLLNECNIYKHDGRRERGHDLIERKGFNFRITEMQSAIGTVQLKKVNLFIRKKKRILEMYKSYLNKVSEVKVFNFQSNEIVPHRVLIFAKKSKKLLKFLNNHGIGVRTTFMPMHKQPVYKIKKKFPISQKLYDSGICLPSAPTLKKKDVKFISNTIEKFYTI